MESEGLDKGHPDEVIVLEHQHCCVHPTSMTAGASQCHDSMRGYLVNSGTNTPKPTNSLIVRVNLALSRHFGVRLPERIIVNSLYPPPLRRSRAVAISILLFTGLLSGLTSADAHAADIDVAGTIDDCSVTISGVGPIDLGTPTVDRSGEAPMYEFQSNSAISVSWATSGVQDCAGSLHAEHGGITKAASPVASAWLSISSDDFMMQNQSINSGSTVEVATSAGGGAGDTDTFGVKLMVAASEGTGAYSATISFSVVVE